MYLRLVAGVVRMDDVLFAAMIWKDARSNMTNMPMKDPEWKTKLNELSEAEDLLSRAVENFRKAKES